MTAKDEWIEVKVPFEQFKGSFRGMSLSKEKFDPGKISRVGLLLGDKKQGPLSFRLIGSVPMADHLAGTILSRQL